ncbi:hypothetical protein JOQ06_023348 [Pogonophryne albipinna]|uniref:Uncharacterized protein n=1 Tax=Pogonophryne albipinna TaxID=1090488 RepID=A0AAD6BK39_9TELE|nr:hypothetical protein JOQ06_023348 [Pogonophryne albipinna]
MGAGPGLLKDELLLLPGSEEASSDNVDSGPGGEGIGGGGHTCPHPDLQPCPSGSSGMELLQCWQRKALCCSQCADSVLEAVAAERLQSRAPREWPVLHSRRAGLEPEEQQDLTWTGLSLDSKCSSVSVCTVNHPPAAPWSSTEAVNVLSAEDGTELL